jgi:hypothetical protein
LREQIDRFGGWSTVRGIFAVAGCVALPTGGPLASSVSHLTPEAALPYLGIVATVSIWTLLTLWLARTLVEKTDLIVGALPHLRRRGQMQRIIPITEQIGRLATAAGNCLRDGLRGLYARPDDPRDIVLSIKWREIYDYLEGATDSASVL